MSILATLTQILFVGHSLVGPDLPPLLEAAFDAKGAHVRVQAQVINGAPLRYGWDHSDEGERLDARAELALGATDVLVLTEAVPLAGHLEWNDPAGQMVKFATLAHDSKAGVQVFLYETWHSLASGPGAAIPDDPGAAVPWRDRVEADRVLWQGIADAASARLPAPVRLVPAGQAMGLMADEIAAGRVPGLTSIRDLFADDIHPNGKGLYLLAMVHLAAITGESPQGLPSKLTRAWPSRDAILTDDQAAVMQRVAWAAAKAQRAREAGRSVAPAAPVAPAVPAPAAATAPPVMTPITSPRLALGLSGVNDWSVQQPFLDVMKTARPFVGHLPGQWGGMEDAALRNGGWLDADGWPRAMPPGVTGLSTLILTEMPAAATSLAGRYRLAYRGQGEVVLGGRAQNQMAAPGAISFDYTPGEGAVIVTVAATDPADPIRAISVVREDRLDLWATGAIFNPDWLARIRGAQGLRFMDWMATNDSTLARLKDRPKPGDATWARNGVPVEVMVALANDLHADPWFTLPHLAGDALVRAYAETVRDSLSPDLVAHVEYSNEAWNWQFAQARWMEEQGRARWGRDNTWVQFYALRAAEVAGIWAEVYGDQARARLVRVVAVQTGWLGLEKSILQAPLVIAEGRPAPATGFDAYAVTGYFSALLGSDAKAAMVKGWLAESQPAAEAGAQGLTGAERDAHLTAHRHDLAVTRAAQELADGSLSGDAEDSLARLLGTVLPHHAAVAKANGLQLVMYEGGTHVVGYGSQVDDAELTAFFLHLNYAPEMADLYRRLMQGWRGLTDAPFNAFVDVYAPNKWGSWGALRHLDDDNPRWQALAQGCERC
ncbi:hypothetical protein RNZ50_20220 [Paracoccaceae bacterium Fryx2]|nr:hypothetical protein [Paracoccaceae bacterium Fryx2]